jgi:hypothetical protein
MRASSLFGSASVEQQDGQGILERSSCQCGCLRRLLRFSLGERFFRLSHSALLGKGTVLSFIPLLLKNCAMYPAGSGSYVDILMSFPSVRSCYNSSNAAIDLVKDCHRAAFVEASSSSSFGDRFDLERILKLESVERPE